MKTFSQVVRNYWVDLILLNLAFLLGCIPVVTIPASLAALCSICRNRASVIKWEQEQVARYPPRGNAFMAR